MTSIGPGRPRVSRETRLLLATVLCSIVALWLLARLRFPERPATPNPVPPLLTQLAPRSTFDDLSKEVLDVEAKILPALAIFTLGPDASAQRAHAVKEVVPALRIQDETAIVWSGLDVDTPAVSNQLVARDPATGLAIVRLPAASVPRPPSWAPQRPEYPRYVLVTELRETRISLRPAFLGPLREAESPAWATMMWMAPSDPPFSPGAFVFTTTGALVGLVVEDRGARAIAPADALLATTDRVLRAAKAERGVLGVEVAALTPAIAAASGMISGVVVTWVDPDGPAAGMLAATDIVDRIDGRSVPTLDHWRARMARLTAGERVTLRFRRGDRVDEVAVTAAAIASTAAEPQRLGLTLRARSGVGVEVIRVDAQSSAAAAGIRAGDIITRIGNIASPTPVQVRRAFEAQPPDGAVLVAIARGDEHLVVALWKR
ncbi:MAG: PDZ domain-containing protein [Acidobacteria bacterium]|nr:PDZ domain-containing protein [Acidobacteriota bacterium]